MAGQEKEAPELQVAKLFQLAGYEVTQSVGAEPGTVDWFATPREGFVRPRTYWQTWKTCPERLDKAAAELEQARVVRQADRALGVVMEGRLPVGYAVDLTKGTTSAITLRRLGLELSGVVDQVRRTVAAGDSAKLDDKWLRRRGIGPDGPISDVAAYVAAWIEDEALEILAVLGARFSGRTTVVVQAMYHVGKRFLADPDGQTPLVAAMNKPLFLELLSRRWVVPMIGRAELTGTNEALKRLLRRSACAGVLCADVDLWADLPVVKTIHLLPPDPIEIEQWIRARLPAPGARESFLRAREEVTDFRRLSDQLGNLTYLIDAAQQVSVGHGPSPVWIAAIVQQYIHALGARPTKQNGIETLFKAFEDLALEQFALGSARSLLDLPEERVWVSIAAPVGTWTTMPEPDPADLFSDGFGQRIGNPLILHYFLARKIAREVRAGNPEILTRYQFPREYVLLFLAILAPDVAAQLSADHGEAMRVQIESEVERRLQLSLAHMLKRSSGAVRSNMKAIERHIERTAPGTFEREFARIDEEVTFQCALAEQTRLLHEVPESEIEGLTLAEYVGSVVADLREGYPAVAYEGAFDPALRVRASREVLREILHCLLENAFQAVASGVASPSVRVEAHSEGDTLRLNVLDNGPGIAPGDRDRVFDLYVTTKKGGDDKPLGTGMGLPIARRYAAHVGAQVGLDPGREQTCFFVRFVTWRDIG
jgi:signal transduction histidine kinase